jgi:hypothetical protein
VPRNETLDKIYLVGGELAAILEEVNRGAVLPGL